MRVTIHQPNYLPYLGFFEKFFNSDVFVVLDHVQYTKNGYQNRNRIYSKNGPVWLTVPVFHKFGIATNEVLIDNSKNWRKQHLLSIQQNYSKSKFFSDVMPSLLNIYSRDWTQLTAFNQSLLLYAFSLLAPEKRIIYSSHLGLNSSGSDLILEICKTVGADEYYSGRSGKNYLKLEDFISQGVKVKFQEFKHPVYGQIHGDFLSNLAFIDFLFNEGCTAFREIFSSSPQSIKQEKGNS